ncbi:MAG TPA: integrase, partial [Candidatus Nitrosotalea sp.]|nr:integrase [Candidatus Nitrosotalea sp.]
MKINLTDIEKVEKNPIELFYDGIKAGATKERYTRILKNILCDILENVLTGTFEERATQFVKKAKNDPDWALSVMLSLAGKLKDRTKLPRTDKNY